MNRRRQRRDRTQRNDPCPCGSNKKAKHCHGTTSAASPTAPQATPVFDGMSGFLEQHVRPEFTRLRAHFQREYVELFARWASEPIHDESVFDTQKCHRLMQLAEERLRAIARSYPRRFLMQALRTLPIGPLALITMNSEAMPLLRTATTAAYLYGGEAPPQELESYAKHLGPNLAQLLGAAFAYDSAQRAFRMAGKGATLIRPAPVPADAIEAMFARYPQDGILVVSAPEFRPDAVLEHTVYEYDRRRARSGPGLAGFGRIEPPIGPGWWQAVIMGSPLEPIKVQVSYPALKQTWTSTSFFVHPVDVAPLWAELDRFADEFPHRFDIDYASFRVLCTALYQMVLDETGWLRLHEDTVSPGEWRLRSESDPNATAAPSFLYDLFARASLRGPRAGFLACLASALSATGIADAEIKSKRFLDRFSEHASLDFSFEPSLFFVVDEHLMALDFLHMNDFFDLVLRQVTSGDDEAGNARGMRFENTARDWIVAALGVQPSQIPVPHHQDVVDGAVNYGDPDLAFMLNGVLVNLDMKSWQKTPRYFRGEYNAIRNRAGDLVKLMKKLDRRGRRLAEIVVEQGAAFPPGVIGFPCVADVEYVPPGETTLWYGETPRVLTPTEIVDLLQDDSRLQTVMAVANEDDPADQWSET